MRVNRTVAAIVAAGLVGAIAFAFVAALDIDQYRDELAAFVETHTGRHFSIDGEIGFKLALVPTLSLERIRLGNPDWTKSDDLIRIERVEAELALVALLRAQLKVKRLHLHGVELMLETQRDGRGNWLFDTEPVTDPSPRYWRPDYDLESVLLSRMVIRFRPRQGETRRLDIRTLKLIPQGVDQPLDIGLNATFNDINLSAEGSMSRLKQLVNDEPFTFDLDGRVGDATFTLAGRTAMPSRAAFDALELSMTAPSLASLGAPFALALPTGGTVSLTTSIGREENRYRLAPLLIGVGSSELRAELGIETTAPRLRIDGEITAPRLDVADFLVADEHTSRGERVFSATELPFAWLSRLDADITFGTDVLVTPSIVFRNLTSRIKIDDAILAVGPAQATVADGVFLARVDVKADRDNPEVALEMSLGGAHLDRLPKFAAHKKISGGSLDLNVNVAGRGRSEQAIMAHANGMLAVDIGSATFDNKAVNLAEADLLWSFVTRLNPLATSDPMTQVECVAVRFPIRDGIAENAAGIGILTRSLSILGGGTVNLATERIDLGARPKPREGLGLSVSGLVDFLRLGGTLKHPQPVTDTAGIATAGAKVGAAVVTGGLSVVVEGLFDRASADETVCAVVRDSLTRGSANSGGGSVIEATPSKAKAAVRGAGSAIKNVFEGLFGN
jgi:uncharacterized protein involved in outer membrane biogenesis